MPLNSGGETFAEFRAGGLAKLVGSVVDANPSMSARTKALLRGPLSRNAHDAVAEASLLIDAFLSGEPINAGELLAKLTSCQQVFEAFSLALVDAIIHVNGNNLPVVDAAVGSPEFNPNPRTPRRLFP